MIKDIKRLIILLLLFNSAAFIQASEKGSVNPTGMLSMAQVTQLVKSQNLDVKAAWQNVLSKQALRHQSGVLHNPELELDSENLFGTGVNTGVDNAETTVKIGTLIEWGGKRHYRLKAATLVKNSAQLHYMAVLATGLKKASSLGFEVLRQQEKLSLDGERLKANQTLLDGVALRVRKGRLSVVEKKRAQILVAQSKLRIKKRQALLASVKDRLSLTWGYAQSEFDVVEGDLSLIEVLPGVDLLREELPHYLEVKKKQLDLALANVAIDIQKSIGAHDWSIAGGIKHDSSRDDQSVVLSVEMPLGIFDRNKGAIEAAESDFKEAEFELQMTLIKAENTLEILVRDIQVLKATIDSLETEIIPQSKEVFAMLQWGYLKGKFSYLEVLEAQKTLFGFKERVIDALADYHTLMLEMKFLTGSLIEGETNEISVN